MADPTISLPDRLRDRAARIAQALIDLRPAKVLAMECLAIGPATATEVRDAIGCLGASQVTRALDALVGMGLADTFEQDGRGTVYVLVRGEAMEGLAAWFHEMLLSAPSTDGDAFESDKEVA